MRNINHQPQGATLLGILFFIVCITIIGMLAIKLTPIYITNHSVKTILISVKNDQRVKSAPSVASLNLIAKRTLIKHLNINQIASIDYADIHIENLERGVRISIKYEERTSYFANIYLVVKFDDCVITLVIRSMTSSY